jgi:hypothetical protein
MRTSAKIKVAKRTKRISTTFWHVTPCSMVEMYRRFGGTDLLPARVLGSLFDTVNGESTLLRNVGNSTTVHGGASQEKMLFTVITLKTSKLTNKS